MKKLFLYIMGIILIISVVGCGGGGTGSPQPTPDNIVLSPNAKVLDNSSLQTISSVSPDGSTIIFNQPTTQVKAIASNDILIIGISPQTPNGLLRQVTAIQN